MKYWLMKSEPSSYSIDDLKKDNRALWDGVRNYQARNFMMHDMQIGDLVLYYHSNTKIPGIVGLAKISGKARPDPTAFDAKNKYYDKKSTKDKPIWYCVEIKFVKKFKNIIPLQLIKEQKALNNMVLVKKGMRLSIQPVKKPEYELICSLEM